MSLCRGVYHGKTYTASHYVVNKYLINGHKGINDNTNIQATRVYKQITSNTIEDIVIT